VVVNKLATLSTYSDTRTLLITTTDCGLQVTFYPENYHKPILHYVTNGGFYYVTHQYNSTIARAATASTNTLLPAQANLMRSPNCSIESIGDPSNLNNFLPDSGVTHHMTPCLADLQDVVGGQKLGVEVADGHVIKCSLLATLLLPCRMIMGYVHFEATLQDAMYVLGLSHCLFSLK